MSQSLSGPLISTDVNNPAQCCCGGPWVLALPCMDGLYVDIDGIGYCPAGEDNYHPPCLWVRYSDATKAWSSGNNFNFWNNGDKRVCYLCAPQTPIDLPEGATVATNITTNNGCVYSTCTECGFCCNNSAPIALQVAVSGMQFLSIPGYTNHWSGSFPGATCYLQPWDTPFGNECIWVSQIIPNVFTFTDPNTGVVTTYGAQWEYHSLGGGLIGTAFVQNADGSYGPQYAIFFWGFTNNLVSDTQRDCNSPGSCVNGVAGGGSLFIPGFTQPGVGTATLTADPPDHYRLCDLGSNSGSGSSSSSGSVSGSESGGMSSSSGSQSGSSSGSNSGSSSSSGSHSGSSGSSGSTSGSSGSNGSTGSHGSTGGGSGGGGGGSGGGMGGGSGAIGDTGSGSAGVAPTTCNCCASFALTLSGGTAADGTVSLQYQGDCFWSLGVQYQLYADDYAWIVIINYGIWQITFVAPLSECPPDTGWTVWSSSASGDPELTLSCSTTSGGSGSGSGSSYSCLSAVACSYCDSTPSIIEVQFASILISGGCIVCSDTSYSLNGTINAQPFLLTQDLSNPCRWYLTTSSPIHILKYFSMTCSGSVVDVSGPLTISLVVESDQTSLIASIETTDGFDVLLFSSTFANIGCSVEQTVYSILSYFGCGTVTEFPRLYAAKGGSALITPCGGASTPPTCLYNTGQSVTLNGFTTGASSPCDADAVWKYNGTPAAAPATQWYPYAFTNTATARWIGAQCDGHGQTTGLGNFNEVTFTIPAGTDLTSFSLTGQFSADNWLDTVSVNSVGLDIGFYGTPSGVYGTYQGYGSVQSYCEANGIGTPNDFGGLNPFTLPTSAAWRIGTNTVLFSIGGNDDFGGLVVVWDTPCGDDGLKFKTSQKPAVASRPRPSCKSCVRRKAA